MSELELSVILNLILFIALPCFGGLLATRVRLPRMIGYILSGMLLGAVLNRGSAEILSVFGNVGLILLLFTVGLEINIDMLKRFGKTVSIIGALQIAISSALFAAIMLVMGMAFGESLIVGFVFALSSTALVSKIIQDRGQETSLVGGMSLSVLLLQDFAVIPFMILMGSVGKSSGVVEIVTNIGMTMLRTGLILGLIYVLGQRLVPIILEKIAVLSRELLNLMTILFIFIFVALFSMLGLSPAIAAFVAGILIGGTLEHYQIFSQMRPLRDIFTILFFVFLGASLKFSEILPILPKALIFVVILIALKFLIVASLFIYGRFHSKTAMSIGLLLAQVGEFAFIVLHQARVEGMVSQETYLFAMTSTLLTIAISPILMERNDKIYAAFRKLLKNYFQSAEKYLMYRVDREPAHIDALNMRDHVIMCGYGRVGSYIGRALTMAQIPFIAIDYDYHQVEEYRKKGISIIYGDPTDIDILDFAQAEYATALISAVPDTFSQEMIVLNAKKLNPKITILTRVTLEKHQQRMKDLGAEVVIQPEFEAALSIVRKILLGYNVSKKDIVGKVKRLKLEHGMA